MANLSGVEGSLRVVFAAEQIGQRVCELARQIADDFHERSICAVCVLEDGFIFMADVIRYIDRPVLCQFIRTDFTQDERRTEIFFSPVPDVQGLDVLLVVGVIQSGLTVDFLTRNLQARGAKSVKVAALLDRGSERHVAVAADYCAFSFNGPPLVGYGLGARHFGRNLPYMAAVEEESAAAAGD